jgi:hypothetical protein
MTEKRKLQVVRSRGKKPNPEPNLDKSVPESMILNPQPVVAQLNVDPVMQNTSVMGEAKALQTGTDVRMTLVVPDEVGPNSIHDEEEPMGEDAARIAEQSKKDAEMEYESNKRMLLQKILERLGESSGVSRTEEASDQREGAVEIPKIQKPGGVGGIGNILPVAGGKIDEVVGKVDEVPKVPEMSKPDLTKGKEKRREEYVGESYGTDFLSNLFFGNPNPKPRPRKNVKPLPKPGMGAVPGVLIEEQQSRPVKSRPRQPVGDAWMFGGGYL